MEVPKCHKEIKLAQEDKAQEQEEEKEVVKYQNLKFRIIKLKTGGIQMFGKKKEKTKLGIPSLTDREKPEPLPELPKFSDEEDQIPKEKVKEPIVEVEEEVEEDNPEDEIPDEIDLEEGEVETGVKEVLPEEVKVVEPVVEEPKQEVAVKKFYTPVGIVVTEQGLIQTTIISNVDLKMTVNQIYDLEEDVGINSSDIPTPPPEFSTTQNQSNMNQIDKKLCLGCGKTIELSENCNCKGQVEDNKGYKVIYAKN